MDPLLLSSLLASVGGPEEFCVSSECKSRVLLARLKDVYNCFQEGAVQPFGPLEELLVDGMDLESIWEELQTWNRPMIRSLKKRVRRLHRNSRSRSKMHVDNGEDDVIEEEGDEEEMDTSGEDEEPELSSSRSERDTESSWDGDDDEEQEFANGRDDYDEGISEDESDLKKTKSTKKKSRVSDEDELDEVSEAEDFLDDFEVMESRSQRRRDASERSGHKSAVEQDDESDFEDDFELAEQELYRSDSDKEGDNDSDQGSEERGRGKDIRFSDFFAADKSATKKRQRAQKSDRVEDNIVDEDGEFDFGDEDDDSEAIDSDRLDSSHDDDDDDDDEQRNQPSKLEEKMRRINEETRKIEEDLVGKKRWDMIGEVKATDRPENSLLEAVADVDRLSKPVPIITKEYTSTVEELIKARIKDENFDDVQPLLVAPKSVRSPFELSQERSSKGLGQLYEEEFLQKSVNTASKPSEKETTLVNEIDDLYEKVSRQLDGLSHFYFTPKPVIREPTLKSVESVPSLSLEDAAPSILNLASTAAPEEVMEKKKGRKAAFLSDADVGRDDRRRLRRAAKAAGKKEKQSMPVSERVKANEKLTTDLQKDRRVVQGKVISSNDKGSSSSVFFEKIQSQAQNDINQRKKGDLTDKKSTKKANEDIKHLKGTTFKL